MSKTSTHVILSSVSIVCCRQISIPKRMKITRHTYFLVLCPVVRQKFVNPGITESKFMRGLEVTRGKIITVYFLLLREQREIT